MNRRVLVGISVVAVLVIAVLVTVVLVLRGGGDEAAGGGGGGGTDPGVTPFATASETATASAPPVVALPEDPTGVGARNPAVTDEDRVLAAEVAASYLRTYYSSAAGPRSSPDEWLTTIAPIVTPNHLAALEEKGSPDGVGVYATTHELGLDLVVSPTCYADTDSPSSTASTVYCDYTVETVDSSGDPVDTSTLGLWPYGGTGSASVALNLSRSDAGWLVAEAVES